MTTAIQPLNLPKAKLQLKKKQGLIYVWCIIRKKDLLLIPEEWVRQHIIHFLVDSIKIPIEKILSEYAIKVNGLSRRCDIVILNEYGNPKMIIECKAPNVAINQQVLFQIAQYNRQLNVEYLMLSNGLQHLVVKINQITGVLEEVDDLREVF